MSIVVDDELYEEEKAEVEVETEDTTKEGAEAKPSFEIPEKFQNKTAEEIAQSYIELEKELGRKNNDIGELRKLTDQFLHQELSRKPNDDPKQEDELSIEFDELVENPAKVVKTVVDKEVAKVTKRFEEQAYKTQVEKFLSNNPDYEEVSQSQEFYNWANASPYRARQLMQAQAGDLEAAQEILSGFREQTVLLKEIAEKEKEAERNEQLAAASTEESGTGETPGRVFKRAELMRMRMSDPDKYESLNEEITKAYMEGRVR